MPIGEIWVAIGIVAVGVIAVVVAIRLPNRKREDGSVDESSTGDVRDGHGGDGGGGGD